MGRGGMNYRQAHPWSAQAKGNSKGQATTNGYIHGSNPNHPQTIAKQQAAAAAEARKFDRMMKEAAQSGASSSSTSAPQWEMPTMEMPAPTPAVDMNAMMALMQMQMANQQAEQQAKQAAQVQQQANSIPAGLDAQTLNPKQRGLVLLHRPASRAVGNRGSGRSFLFSIVLSRAYC